MSEQWSETERRARDDLRVAGQKLSAARREYERGRHAAAGVRTTNAAFLAAREELAVVKAKLDAAQEVYDTAESAVRKFIKPVLTLDERIRQAIAEGPEPWRISVRRNESVYHRDGQFSWFRDLMTSAQGDTHARERLIANERELRSPVDNSAGAGFNPPAWLADEYVQIPRPGRPVADVVDKVPLPEYGLTGHVPQMTAGATTAVQADEGDNVSDNTTSITSQTADSAYVSILGQLSVDWQLAERQLPNADAVWFSDLTADYNKQLEAQLLTGSGSSGQLLGLTNVTGRLTVTYTSGSPTAAEALQKAIYASVKAMWNGSTGLGKGPTHLVMHPDRWAFFAEYTSTNVPLLNQGGGNPSGNGQPSAVVGTLGGIPVLVDSQIPENLGVGSNQDLILAIHAPDIALAEMVQRYTFDQVTSNVLAVRFQVYGGAMFFPHRQPKATCVVSGTGLVVS